MLKSDREETIPVYVAAAPNTVPVKVGEAANTKAPDPVSSVTADAIFALEGVAKNVAIPVPSPETPVLIGSPVPLVRVMLVGVPCAMFGSVVEREGMPPLSVTRTALLAVAKSEITFAALDQRIRLMVVVAGHVVVLHAGVVEDPL